MPIYLFWGEDEFLISRAVNALKTQFLAPNWSAFNLTTYPTGPESIALGTTDLMTPPVGRGHRLVYLPKTSWLGAMDDQLLAQIQQAIASMPPECCLVLTSPKLDKRLKSVRYFLEVATQTKAFPRLKPWDSAGIAQRVRVAAEELELTLTPTAVICLSQAVGTNTAQLYSELQKLAVYTQGHPIKAFDVQGLVDGSAATTIDLAKQLLHGHLDRALDTLNSLQQSGEAPLKILATSTTLFRQWLWVKVLVNEGVSDNSAIASASGIGNPGRVYYLRQEVQGVDLDRLRSAMGIFWETEILLKSQVDPGILSSQFVKLAK